MRLSFKAPKEKLSWKREKISHKPCLFRMKAQLQYLFINYVCAVTRTRRFSTSSNKYYHWTWFWAKRHTSSIHSSYFCIFRIGFPIKIFTYFYFSFRLYLLLIIFTVKQRMQSALNPYPTAFPYGNGMVLHFYQQQESSTTKTVHKVINKGLKTYV